MSKQSFWQMIVAVLLIGFPAVMIVVNGNRALKGILWNAPEVIAVTADAQSLAGSNPATGAVTRNKAPLFGVYDPENHFGSDSCFNMEQVYISWIDFKEAALRLKIEKIIASGRSPFITIEPWNGTHPAKTLLQDISKGVYDSNIQRIISALSGFNKPFYLSWGHEMDQDLTKRYPWSGSDPEDFIAAYRYVSGKLKSGLSNELKWIWSPVGKKGCENYWPGAEYVNYVGMPLYSYPDWDKSYYGHIRSFKSWYEEKYALVKQFNKPVFIVEMGVTGSPDYQTYWLQEAFDELKSTPSIEAVLFFYSADTPGSWGSNIATPDWRTNPDVLRGLVSWMQGEYKTKN